MSVGEALAEARIRAGLTIEEVSARSLIRQTVINAMERDDYEACGGSMYINGYIRAVAAAIGIDPRPLIAAYAEARHQAQSAADGVLAQEPPATPAPEPLPDSEEAPGTESEPDVDSTADGVPVASDREPASDRAPASDPEPAPDPEAPSDPEPGPDLGPAPDAEPVPDPGSDLGPLPGPGPLPDLGPGTGPDPEPGPQPGPAPGPIVQRVSTPEAEVTLVDMFLPLTDPEPEPSSPVPVTPQEPSPRRPSPQQRKPEVRRPRTRPEESRPGRTRERRRLRLAAVSTVVVLVVVAVAVTELVTHASHSQNTAANTAKATVKASAQATTPTTPSPTAAPTPTTAASPVLPAVTTLAPAGVEAFGPSGPADGDNDNIADRAIGGGTTGWQSNWYTSPTFGDLKQGTGLLVDMGSVVGLNEVIVQLGGEAGADLQIKTGTASDAFTTRNSATNATGTVTLKVTGRARYILLWFTQLPPDGDGTYQVNVHNITVKGYKI